MRPRSFVYNVEEIFQKTLLVCIVDLIAISVRFRTAEFQLT